MTELIIKNQNKSWINVGINFLILGLLSLTFSYSANKDEWFYHGIFFTLSSLVVSKKFLKLIYLPKEILFYDLRWIFLFSFWFYFVLGPSLLIFADSELINNTSKIYPVDLNSALRINSINAIGLSIVLILISKFKLLWPSNIISALKNKVRFFDPLGHRSLILGICFCLFSLFKVFLVGQNYLDKSIFHGIFQIFQQAGIGFSLIFFYYKGKFRKLICLVVAFYLCLYVFIGYYNLDKSMTMAPIVFFLICYCIKKNSFKLLALIVIGFFFLTQVFGVITSYNRSNKTKISFSEVIFSNKLQNTYSLWDRINYMSSQSAALDLYSEGEGGENLKNIYWIFIPRFLNKDKPDVSSSSSKFSKKFRSQGGTRDSPGVFVEGYFNYGWIGLIFVSIIIGLIVKIYSVLIKSVITNKLYSFYFIIFSGIWTCFRIDGLIITDYLGQLVIFLYFTLLIIFILTFLRLLTISK